MVNNLLEALLSLAVSKPRRGSDLPIFFYELILFPSREGIDLDGGKGNGISWQVRGCGRVSLSC